MSERVDEVLRDYVAAWNEPDDAARERLLRGCVVDSVVMSPGYKPDAPPVHGRDELSAEIGAMIAGRPAGGGYRLGLDSEPEEHHGWVRFWWSVADRTGATLTVNRTEVVGMDLVHVGEHGRLDTIVVFLG